MGKETGEARLENGSERIDLRSRRRQTEPPPMANGDFVRAFADALRDILNHERRRAA
jgi:hypothetical protein